MRVCEAAGWGWGWGWALHVHEPTVMQTPRDGGGRIGRGRGGLYWKEAPLHSADDGGEGDGADAMRLGMPVLAITRSANGSVDPVKVTITRCCAISNAFVSSDDGGVGCTRTDSIDPGPCDWHEAVAVLLNGFVPSNDEPTEFTELAPNGVRGASDASDAGSRRQCCALPAEAEAERALAKKFESAPAPARSPLPSEGLPPPPRLERRHVPLASPFSCALEPGGGCVGGQFCSSAGETRSVWSDESSAASAPPAPPLDDALRIWANPGARSSARRSGAGIARRPLSASK